MHKKTTLKSNIWSWVEHHAQKISRNVHLLIGWGETARNRANVAAVDV